MSNIIKVPATSANVGPGFDCLGLALNLYNEIEYEVLDKDGELLVEILGEGKNDLAKDKRNLIYKAYESVFEYLKRPVKGIRLKLTNNIPLSRGLGSSSAAIIGGIVLANRVLEGVLSEKEILKIALKFEHHPDNIAPALLGGFIVSMLNGEEVVTKKLEMPSEIRATVIVPQFELSTEKSRQVLPETVSMKDAVFNVSRTALLVSAICSNDLEAIKLALEDRLHQNYRASLIPGLSEVIEEANKMDILGIALSGAGPSIIIFHKEDVEMDIDLLVKILKDKEVYSEIYNLKPVNVGTI